MLVILYLTYLHSILIKISPPPCILPANGDSWRWQSCQLSFNYKRNVEKRRYLLDAIFNVVPRYNMIDTIRMHRSKMLRISQSFAHKNIQLAHTELKIILKGIWIHIMVIIPFSSFYISIPFRLAQAPERENRFKSRDRSNFHSILS